MLRKAIKGWLKNKQTLDFLEVWEKRNNPKFKGAQMGAFKQEKRYLTLRSTIDILHKDKYE